MTTLQSLRVQEHYDALTVIYASWKVKTTIVLFVRSHHLSQLLLQCSSELLLSARMEYVSGYSDSGFSLLKTKAEKID